jgi:phage recombination protein Bet
MTTARKEALVPVSIPASVPIVTPEQRDLARRTIAPQASDDNFAVHLYNCSRLGVHPLDQLVVYTEHGGKYTPVASINFLRSRAAATGEMAGSDDAVFVTRDGDEFPLAATVTVYRLTHGMRFAYTATARWDEYCPAPGPKGTGDRMWQKMPHTMLAKCAEALALRKAFPQELGGLYVSEELDQADRGVAPGRADLEAAARGVPPSRAAAGDAGESLGKPTIGSPPPSAPGLVYITDVRESLTKNQKTRYTLTVAGGPDWPANATTVMTFNPRWADLARECQKSGAPLKLKTKRTDFGLDVASLERVDDQGNVLPLTDSDIPFR